MIYKFIMMELINRGEWCWRFIFDLKTVMIFTGSGCCIHSKLRVVKTAAKFINDGAVELYHNNAKKLETISDGVKITGELQVTDDITAFFSSDERLKLNITPIKEPLAKVLSISGNTFTWIEGGVHEGEDTGVIAQEIDALGLPGLTVTRETGYMAVKYDKLTALLIEAVKELSMPRLIFLSKNYQINN